MTKQYDAFISYADADGGDFAVWLAGKLQDRGVLVFLDKWEVLLGDEIVETLATAIEQSAYFIIVLTRRYLNSGWCTKELYQKLTEEAERENNVILPILADQLDIPPYLKSKLHFRLTPTNWADCLDAVLTRIRRDRALRKTEATGGSESHLT